ncbi:MAG: DUF3362 domain-containing protein, partial [Gammaproteobacteria bacterium]|nr:DUF3362 domain-containing protein [Gammaproteobacteria bacterium]
HKAFLRYHDPANWPILREALTRMGRDDLIGSARHQLIPAFQAKQSSSSQHPHHRKSFSNKGSKNN